MRKTFAALAATIAVLVLSAGPAAADYQSGTETVWAANGACLRAQAELSYSNVQGPYWTARATAQAGSGDWGSCAANSGYEPPAGWLEVRMDLWRSDGSAWTVCESSGWSVSDQATFMWSASTSGGTGPCGAGWYGLVAQAGRWDGGAWEGASGSSWSGAVWVDGPAYYTAPA